MTARRNAAMRIATFNVNGVNAGLAFLFVAAYHRLELPRIASFRQRVAALPDAIRGFAYGSAIVFLLLQTPPGTGAFIYQQF